jgi:medium-chain acyl-[acyl-carrier-protein] hydrolase
VKSTTSSPWIARPKVVAAPTQRLFCLPYAGGAPHVFNSWAGELPPDVEMCAIALPGRGRRFSEPPYERMSPLVDALAAALIPWLDRPYSVFGHSMGAHIGFELAVRLRDLGMRQPSHLFVSGASAPQLPDRHSFHTLPDDRLLADVTGLNGLDADILANREFLELMLPTLRADFAVVETHTLASRPPLGCPLSVFGGSDDWLVPVEELEPWRQHTTRTCTVDVFPGDHFFIRSSERDLLKIVGERLTSQ